MPLLLKGDIFQPFDILMTVSDEYNSMDCIQQFPMCHTISVLYKTGRPCRDCGGLIDCSSIVMALRHVRHTDEYK